VAAAIALIPLSPATPALGMPILMVSQFFGDAFGSASLILGRSLSQSLLPPALLGRATAAYRAVGGGLAVVGALAGGLLGEALGLRGALWVGVAGLAVTPLIGLASRLPRLRDMPRTADG
jgi:MFS family permease